MEEWITVAEASRRFGLSTAWIYQLINEKRLQARKAEIGRATLVDAKELERKTTPRPLEG